MKIVIALNTSWNIYNFRMGLVKALVSEGHEVHTIAPVDSYTPYLKEAGCIHHPLNMDSRGANFIKDIALMVELFFLYRRIRPDVALHYTIKPNIYGTLASTILGIPAINNVCGLGTVFLNNSPVSRIAIQLYRLSFRFARKVFFQNDDDLHLFLNRNLVKPGIVEIIPGSGIDLNKFTPAENYTRNSPFTFLMVSRLISDKGVFEYVEAVRKLREQGLNARFQLLGSLDPEDSRGIRPETVQRWMHEGIIEYLGASDDVYSYIRKADCVVLPSYREGTPRTLLEAASSGKPVVATDVPGCNHVVQHGVNGFLCQLKDPVDLAKKMALVSGLDDDKLIALGKNGRKKMEAEYDENFVIHKYLKTLSSLRKVS